MAGRVAAQARLFDGPVHGPSKTPINPAPAAAPVHGVTLADLVEQIRRDTEAERDGWPPGPAFYRERIASYRAFALSFAPAQSTV